MRTFSISRMLVVLSLAAVLNTGCSSSSMLSKAGDFLGVLTNNPNLSSYLSLLNAAGGLEKILPGGLGTLLVPNNDALAKIGQDALNNLTKPENIGQLQNILKGHALGQSLSPTKLGKMGELTSLAGGAPLAAVKTDSGLKIGDANVTESIKTPTGYIHVIDKVLGQ